MIAGQGQPDLAVVEPVADDAVLAGQARRHLDLLAREGLAGVDQRRHGEHLLHRAGLVDVAQRARAEVVLVGLERLVGVEGRARRPARGPRRCGCPCTIAAPLSARYSCDGLGEHLLGEPLEVAVDGGAQRRAVLRRLRACSRAAGCGTPLPELDCQVASPSMPASCLSKVRSKPPSGSSVPMKPMQVGGHVTGRVVADRVVLAA